MNNLKVDFKRSNGKIKAMHAVGQPPWLGLDGGFLHYLTEAHIPYSRLHDMGGAYGGYIYVDVPNIFRNFDADENDPCAYDFTYTDILIQKLCESGCMPYYRLGVTIENNAAVKSYRIDPPSDYGKWSRICEHIIRHYREGWADGFEYDIVYWEIWNECDNEPDPDKNPMWKGTHKQYYELYDVASKHLRACFGDSIKIGGYASSGLYSVVEDPHAYGLDFEPQDSGIPAYRNDNFMSFFKGFVDHIKANDSPIDFFSWHSYAGVKATVVMEKFVEKHLCENGFGNLEIHVNEWNNAATLAQRGTSYASATCAEMMIRMQKTECSMMHYYDARIGPSIFGGLFDPMTREPLCAYYSLKAFGELYSLGNMAECEYTGDGDIQALAAVNESGEKYAVLIANADNDVTVNCDLPGMRAYLIDREHMMTETDFDGRTIEIKQNQVVLLIK